MHERRLRHTNSLVLLELRLLDISSVLWDDILILNNIDEQSKRSGLTIQKLIPLDLEDSFFTDSYVQELSQKLYRFRSDLKRINNDINNFNRVYVTLGNTLLTNNIDPAKLQTQLDGLLIDKDDLLEGFKRLMNQSDRLLAYVRVRQDKDKTLLMKYRNWLIQKRIKKVTDGEVDQKLKKHLQDIEDERNT